MSGKLAPFIFGGALGAVVALLYAPKTGEETRAYVADKANEAWGNAQNFGTDAQTRGQQFAAEAKAKGETLYQNLSENAQQTYAQASTRAQDAVAAVQARVQEAKDNGAPFAANANDELREKIEAARQRIAAQVAKNAEAAKDAPGQVEAEAVIETVETVDDAAKA